MTHPLCFWSPTRRISLLYAPTTKSSQVAEELCRRHYQLAIIILIKNLRIRELENFFLLISWKLRKKSVSLQREHKIAKIWQDTSTHSQTGRSKESSARNTAKTCWLSSWTSCSWENSTSRMWSLRTRRCCQKQKTNEVSSTTSFAKLTQVSTLSLKSKQEPDLFHRPVSLLCIENDSRPRHKRTMGLSSHTCLCYLFHELWCRWKYT